MPMPYDEEGQRWGGAFSPRDRHRRRDGRGVAVGGGGGASEPPPRRELDDREEEGGLRFYQRPRLAKCMFVASLAFVACSFGLVATGLVMMVNARNDAAAEEQEQQPEGLLELTVEVPTPSPIRPLHSLDWEWGQPHPLDSKEEEEDGVDATTTTDFEAEDDDPVEDDNLLFPGSATDEPTGSPTREPTTSPSRGPSATEPPTGGPSAEPSASPTGEPTSGPTAGPASIADDVEAAVVGTTLKHLTLEPVEDSWIEDDHPDKNFGDKKRLKVDGKPRRIALLKFDMSSLDDAGITPADVRGTTLRLYSLTPTDYGGRVELLGKSCSNMWTEEAVTWNDAPNCVFRNHSRFGDDSLGHFSFDRPLEAWSWNEVALNWTRPLRTEGIMTLRIMSERDNGVTYASRHNETAAPELVVYYEGR
ncbi:hypothetical protein ACHAWF_016887 [Thalassiosira exigua]